MALRALIIDDEKNIRTTLSMCLEGMGWHVSTGASAEAALTALDRHTCDLAFLDLRLGESNGLDLLPRLLRTSPNLVVIVITAYATFDTAVEAIKRGAKDYLPKPFTPVQIRHVVEQLVERRELTRRVSDLAEQLRDAIPEVDLETQAQKMRAVFDLIARAARSEATLLLRGESGTGKGVLARPRRSPLPAQRRRSISPPLARATRRHPAACPPVLGIFCPQRPSSSSGVVTVGPTSAADILLARQHSGVTRRP